MAQNVANRKEGYIDPYTNKFVETSYLKMANMQRTHNDEKIRKACFEAREKLSETNLDNYIQYVGLLNQYASDLGYEDFYAFKIQQEEGMTKQQLFKIFDDIYEKTKYALKDVREIEKTMKGLRKPWNFSYMMSGDFTKEEDRYYPFDQALSRWGRSFTGMGIDFEKGKLKLDLMDRKGKYANGFCHWPLLVHYKDNVRVPAESNFTCNVVYGQVGSAKEGYVTLFHEGGHAVHMLNITEKDTCLNHEYPPMSTAWAETQSMFLDTVFSSYEWTNRYAKNEKGEDYPFELYKRKVEKLNILRPLSLMGIIAMSEFEKTVYETKNLTKTKLIKIAETIGNKYFDYSTKTRWILNVPHIYSWSSACSYHGYGLADIAVFQWREYFNKKYGYITDNPKVGEEMKKVWQQGAKKTFDEFVKEATGQKLSATAWIYNHTKSVKEILNEAKKTTEKMGKIPQVNKTKFTAGIKMVDGKKTIATNAKSFEEMADRYGKWLNR
jgi:oligoendopeptidase F